MAVFSTTILRHNFIPWTVDELVSETREKRLFGLIEIVKRKTKKVDTNTCMVCGGEKEEHRLKVDRK
jgi:hypothetical protein